MRIISLRSYRLGLCFLRLAPALLLPRSYGERECGTAKKASSLRALLLSSCFTAGSNLAAFADAWVTRKKTDALQRCSEFFAIFFSKCTGNSVNCRIQLSV